MATSRTVCGAKSGEQDRCGCHDEHMPRSRPETPQPGQAVGASRPRQTRKSEPQSQADTGGAQRIETFARGGVSCEPEPERERHAVQKERDRPDERRRDRGAPQATRHGTGVLRQRGAAHGRFGTPGLGFRLIVACRNDPARNRHCKPPARCRHIRPPAPRHPVTWIREAPGCRTAPEARARCFPTREEIPVGADLRTHRVRVLVPGRRRPFPSPSHLRPDRLRYGFRLRRNSGFG